MKRSAVERMERLGDELAALVKTFVERKIAPLEDQVRALVQRCDAQGKQLADLQAKLAALESPGAKAELDAMDARWMRPN